jgi:serine/threonine-protein phosphatase PP1 catalytic subunit
MAASIHTFIRELMSFNSKKIAGNAKSPQGVSYRFNISPKVIIQLSADAAALMQHESNLLALSAPIVLFGDIHGQFTDLVRFLEVAGLPPKTRLLFMGDYVDRGPNSIEVIALLFALKIAYPTHVFLLRGNHECPEVNCNYGFLAECYERYNSDAKTVFTAVNRAFLWMPLAAVINKKVFCVHGGISPELQLLSDIAKIKRNVVIPTSGLMCDLLWSDPTTKKKDTSSANWGRNDRGVSCIYTAEHVRTFLQRNGLELICRAHQVVQRGYEFFADNTLVTIFSAPNYCGHHKNDGAILKISPSLECSFIVAKS